MLKKICNFKKILNLLIIIDYSRGDFTKTSFNLLNNNLPFKRKELENNKNYYNILIENLLPFQIYLDSFNIIASPNFNNQELPFLYVEKKDGKKIPDIYNETIYYLNYLHLLEEEINLLKDKMEKLEKIVNIGSYEFLKEIKNTSINILKREKEILEFKNKISKNYGILKSKFNYEMNPENINFMVPILAFDEKKINKYIWSSYFYKKSLYELKLSFNDYWCIGNFQIIYGKAEEDSKENTLRVKYNVNLKTYLEDIKITKEKEFLKEILLTNKTITNKVNILKILKIQKEFLEMEKQNIEIYINNYEKNIDMDNILKIYKKKIELIGIRKKKLRNLHDKVQNLFHIYIELIPLNACKKVYEIPFVD